MSLTSLTYKSITFSIREKLQHTLDEIMNGSLNPVYPLYANLFNGLQTSAVECFVEDTTRPDSELKVYEQRLH